MMSRGDFWKLVLFSSLISTGFLYFLLRGPAAVDSQAAPPPAWTPTALDLPLTEDEAVNIDIYERLGRAVVNITATTIEYNWFYEAIPRQGVGSGFIIDNLGHVVTNFHVIEDAKQLEVTLSDETVLDAEVVGLDPMNDIAVLKIECPVNKCRAVELATSDTLRVGQKVLAIGNPFGLQRTLTTGIISSLGRSLRTDYGFVEDVIQTDAAINPGNSGGPLLDTSGRLVGINTAIFSRTGDSAGIGFAIPSNTLRRILPDLLEHGKVIRPWFGVSGRPIRGRLARALKAPVEEGFLVESIERGSTADLAGIGGGNRRVYYGNTQLLIGGDIITELGGIKVTAGVDLMRVLEDKRPGEKTRIVYYRNDRRIEAEIELVGSESSRRRLRF